MKTYFNFHSNNADISQIAGLRKLLFLAFFIALGFYVQSCRSPSTSTAKRTNTQVEEILKRAKNQIGTRYRAGGNNASGFDCSGFVRYCFEPIGIKLPASAAQQAEVGKKLYLSEARKGDLIFFKGGDAKSKTVGHVGIVVGGEGDDLEFIHASSSKGIMTSKLGEKYFKPRLTGLRRVVGVLVAIN